MRIATLSIDFGLLLLVLVALLQGTTATPGNGCPSDCVSSEKCEHPMGIGVCPKSQETCCSILKNEFRTACRHHGGECMDRCNANLVRKVNDCPANKMCCVLV